MVYRLAALSIGLIVGAYWLRVLRMARKARRKTGRAANFLPPEMLGRMLRVVWIPVVAIWIAQPFVTAIGRPDWAAIEPLFRSTALAWAAAAIVFAGFLATRACWKLMGKSWRMGIDPAEKTELVCSGPWARVRHPIYALSQLMMLATMIAIPGPVLLAAGFLHLSLLQWEARREEVHLLTLHGTAYAEYCVRVRRFFPFQRARPSAHSETTT
jgi:protein-S-isoprenylcysteine O-methyltransferase Ste14